MVCSKITIKLIEVFSNLLMKHKSLSINLKQKEGDPLQAFRKISFKTKMKLKYFSQIWEVTNH